MVLFVERSDMQKYETTIEGGISIIEQSVRWNVQNGITPQDRVMKFNFGDENVIATKFGVGFDPDKIVHRLHVGARTQEIPYPWILPMINIAGAAITQTYGPHLKAQSPDIRPSGP